MAVGADLSVVEAAVRSPFVRVAQKFKFSAHGIEKVHAGLQTRHDQAIVAKTETSHLGGRLVSVEFSARMQAENGGGENIDEPQIARPLIPCR
ncbi:hypothetical protein D3C78_1004300 [compost metagenome]